MALFAGHCGADTGQRSTWGPGNATSLTTVSRVPVLSSSPGSTAARTSPRSTPTATPSSVSASIGSSRTCAAMRSTSPGRRRAPPPSPAPPSSSACPLTARSPSSISLPSGAIASVAGIGMLEPPAGLLCNQCWDATTAEPFLPTVTRFECSRSLPKVEWEGGTARAKSRQQLGGRAQSRRLNRLVADNKRAAQRSKDARHARSGWMGRVQPHARDPGGGLHRRGGASRRCVGRRDSVPPFPAPAPCTRATLGATRQMCLAFQRRETESAGVLFVPRVCGGSWSGALNADREGGGSLRQ